MSLVKLSIVSLAVVLLSGACTSLSDDDRRLINETRAMSESAKVASERALEQSRAAAEQAKQAGDASRAAQAAAAQSAQQATEAANSAKAASERADRAFQRGLRK